MIDGSKTTTNFNQTLHNINTLNNNLEGTSKPKELSNTAAEKKPNNLMSSDKTIEM